MIFSEKGRGAPFLRKNHPLNQQCPIFLRVFITSEAKFGSFKRFFAMLLGNLGQRSALPFCAVFVWVCERRPSAGKGFGKVQEIQ
jgi:hypothetical protein